MSSEIAVAKGKDQFDKRQSIKERESKREMARAIREVRRWAGCDRRGAGRTAPVRREVFVVANVAGGRSPRDDPLALRLSTPQPPKIATPADLQSGRPG